MDAKKVSILVDIAEKEISKILEKLELDTACVVDRISVKDFDVTSINDDRPQLIRKVLIEVLRQPGTKWSQ